MLDLLLKAEYDGADISDVGIREEVDTFMFEVNNWSYKLLRFELKVINLCVYFHVILYSMYLNISNYKPHPNPLLNVMIFSSALNIIVL